MCDHLLDKLVSVDDSIIFPYSRIFCDVERYDSDDEIMNNVGMGILYTKTHDLKDLRTNPSLDIKKLYYSHHKKLNDIVDAELKKNDNILFIDLHSYSKNALKYELYKDKKRPEICIGLNEFYNKNLVYKLIYIIKEFGYSYIINEPFSGCLTPNKYVNDKRVNCIMIEIRKDVYETLKGIEKIKKFLKCVKNL